MQSLQADHTPMQSLTDTLKLLLGCHDAKILSKSGGGNSVVYCVDVGVKKLAVKSYPPYAPGKRDRLAAEVMVYQFLNEHHVSSVPALKLFSTEDRLLVMEWMDGEIPVCHSADDIEQAIAFIAEIARLNAVPRARELPLAAEACLSLTTIIGQISQRLLRLLAAAEHESQLQEFLQNEFMPVFQDCQESAKAGFAAAGLNPDAELPQEKRSLIPADFGFHNTIRDKDNRLHFFDFDYFGWDDPVKLLADILWHPKMTLTAVEQQQFIRGIANVYRNDATFLPRFHHTLALFGLRWTLIFLNEFIPEFWQNRQHAEVHANQDEAKINQLQRARATLLNVKNIGSQYEFIT